MVTEDHLAKQGGSLVRRLDGVRHLVRNIYRPSLAVPAVAPAAVLHTVLERDFLLLLLCVYRDTSNRPAQVTNPEGTLLLGYRSDGSGSENLDVGEFDPQFLSYGFLGLPSHHYVTRAFQMIPWRPVLP